MSKKIAAALLAVIVSGFIFVSFAGKKIDNIANISFDQVSKIVFYDGRGGLNNPLAIEDKQKVKEFMDYIDNYVVKETENPEKVGWIHSAVFYENDKRLMKITFVDPLIINGKYYRVIRGGLSTEKIDGFIKSVNPNWKES